MAMDPEGKKRKITEKNRGFNISWTESFAFIANAEGLPVCLLYNEKLSNKQKKYRGKTFPGKASYICSRVPSRG